MPYDENLILKGKYSGAYVDLDTNDADATSLTVNDDGNLVVDLGPAGTGAKGLDCVVILHDVPVTYQDTCDIVIQDSDHLTDGWQDLLSFPRLYCYMREVIVTATTAFVATDIGLVATLTTGLDTGIIREFSRKLLAIGGTGKMWIEMQDAGDTYDSAADIISATAGTGVGLTVGVSRIIQTPLTLVRRFSTPKRYIRCATTVTVVTTGNFGDVDILVTGSQHCHINNLYRG